MNIYVGTTVCSNYLRHSYTIPFYMVLKVPFCHVGYHIHVYCSEYVGHMQILDY
jgi:hypothetical protein